MDIRQIRIWALERVLEKYYIRDAWPPRGWEDIATEANKLVYWVVNGGQIK